MLASAIRRADRSDLDGEVIGEFVEKRKERQMNYTRGKPRGIVPGTEMKSIVSQLAGLAEQINAAHRLCESSFRERLQHAIRAGELLIEAKALCRHGAWLGWLAAHCDVSEQKAQTYMRIARNREALEAKAQRVDNLSFREAVALLAKPGAVEEIYAQHGQLP